MNTNTYPVFTWRFPSIALLVLATAMSAQAGSGRNMPANVPQTYKQECASCHTAYPPGLLPKPSWRRVMNGLDNHYGSDAALEPATVKQLSGWLEAHAGTYKRVTEEPPQDRITRSAWFQRKHRKIETVVWKHASVKSAANCAACHAGADQGEFDDNGLRVPAGLDPHLLRAWNN